MSHKRFNPNVTASNHAGCIVAAQTKRYKLANLELIKAGIRKSITYKSGANGTFGVDVPVRTTRIIGRGKGYSKRLGMHSNG